MAGLLALGVPSAAAEPLDERGLRQALLEVTDFPPGWATDSDKTAERRGIGVPSPVEDHCRELFESASGLAARAQFARSSSGPFVTTSTEAHAGPEQAREVLEDLREAAGECESFRAREGTGRHAVMVGYEAEELEMKGLGDDSVAVRFHRVLEGEATTPVVADVVISRVGSHTVRVAQAGREDVESERVEPLAVRAVERLQQVLDGIVPTPAPDQPDSVDL